MSKFTGPLTITEISADDELWRLEDDLVYYTQYKEVNGVVEKSGEIIVIKGFISDGASVPAFLERWWPRWGKWRRAAVLHDYLTSLIDLQMPHMECLDRKTADGIFWDAMSAVGVKWLDKVCLYIGAKLATIFPSLGKGVVKNASGFEYLNTEPSKTPSVITNKKELMIDLLLENPDDNDVQVQTNRGPITEEL